MKTDGRSNNPPSNRSTGPTRPGGRPGPFRNAPPEKSALGALTLSAWDLARTRKKQPDSPRGQVMTLRAHQRLVAAFEADRNIPEHERSFLRIKESAKGSCLFIHGVSSGPGNLRELANQLFEADFNVFVLRLPDHGTEGDTISVVPWKSSLNLVRQDFRLLARGGGKVHVVGMGFGAALAMQLASKENVSSLVLLAPALMPRNSFFQRMVVALKLHRLPFVHRFLGWNADLVEGMNQARGKVGKIRVPIFAAQCEDDDRACPASLRFLQRKASHSASRFRVFPDGGHSILEAHGEDVLFKDIRAFFRGGH